jgi:hypothetical protein
VGKSETSHKAAKIKLSTVFVGLFDFEEMSKIYWFVYLKTYSYVFSATYKCMFLAKTKNPINLRSLKNCLYIPKIVCIVWMCARSNFRRIRHPGALIYASRK